MSQGNLVAPALQGGRGLKHIIPEVDFICKYIAFLQCIAIMQHMKAQPIAQAKEVRDDGSIIQIAVWALPEPVPPCTHFYKYRLYFGCDGVCFVRYDNERGKGDHKHLGSADYPYTFTTLDILLDDFETDVTNWR